MIYDHQPLAAHMNGTQTDDVEINDDHYRLVWGLSPSAVDVDVYKRTYVETDGIWMFHDKDGPPYNTASLEEADLYFHAYFKWDGCCDFTFDHLHFCGPDDIRDFFAVIEHLYKRSRELMPLSEDPW